MTVPDAMIEAAHIDGCGDVRVFLNIILPISKSALTTVAIFAFINSWNSYMWPLTVTNSTSMRTVQIGIRYMISADLGTDWPKLMAASTLVVVPVIVVFACLQKYFVEGITKVGLKG